MDETTKLYKTAQQIVEVMIKNQLNHGEVPAVISVVYNLLAEQEIT